MKKYIALLLSLLFIFALCACGDNGGTGEDDPAVSPEVSADVDDPNADPEATDDPEAISNEDDPEASPAPQTIPEELGIEVSVPADVTDAVWTKVDGEPPIAQLDFKLFGYTYCFRAQVTGEAKDISGISFQNPEIDDSNVEFVMTLEGDKGVVTWFIDGVSYSVYMESHADFDELLIIHDEFTPEFDELVADPE